MGMRPVKHVLGPPTILSRDGFTPEKVREFSGQVVFSETGETRYGSNLVLRVEGTEQEIWWTKQATLPASIEAGDWLRGFYQKITNGNKVIDMAAYELQDADRNVRTRTCLDGYKFVEMED